MSDQQFALSEPERTLLALFNTVPVSVRPDVGSRLFDAWADAPAADRKANEARRKAAWERFDLGELGVDVMDDLRAGEEVRS